MPRRAARYRSVRRDAEFKATYHPTSDPYLAKTGSLALPSFVDDIDISVNEQLARSLNISVPQKATLIAAVHAGRSKRTP